MKVLNAKPNVSVSKEDLTVTSKITKSRMVDKFPCWYADLEKGDTIEEYHWKIGCVSENEEKECVVMLTDVGDVTDRDVLEKAFSNEFSIKLVDLFKQNGESAVKDWIAGGSQL
jgi:hypothetical protein